MNLKPYLIREQIIATVRDYFTGGGYHEAYPQLLSESLPTEPTVYPFETTWNTIRGAKHLYLAVSPEAGLKKLIAAGLGNCFCIGKSFRNLEGLSDRHRPEFLMLEWYREHATYDIIMDETESLVGHIRLMLFPEQRTVRFEGHDINTDSPWKRYPMTRLFSEYAHLDLSRILDDAAMTETAKKKGYRTEDATWEQLFNQIFLNEIEPHIGIEPCFITDFPSRISPLCKPKDNDPDFAERFEFYLAGMEIGNGNTERTDSRSIEDVFRGEYEKRRELDPDTAPVDREFLTAVELMNGKCYAGVGIGIDRLAMFFSDTSSIGDLDPTSSIGRSVDS